MLLNFVLHSMRELDKATTPSIKTKQCVAYTGVEIFGAYYGLLTGRIYAVRNPTP